MPTTPLIAALAVICVSPSGGTPAGEFCRTTIQAAVNVARPGTLIRVLPGVYVEAVVVPPRKDGIQIVGTGPDATLVDGAGGTAAITVRSADVEIRDLGVRNAIIGVSLQAPHGTVSGLKSGAGIGVGIAGTGSESAAHQILSNDVQGIAVFGPDLLVRDNRVRGELTVSGERGSAIGNQVEGGRLNVFGTVFGETVTVRANRVHGAPDVGIQVLARNPVVEGNVVSQARSGLNVGCLIRVFEDPDACLQGSISDNIVTDTITDGLIVLASSPGLPVRRNRVERAGRGVVLVGRGLLAQGNRALGNLGAGIAVLGGSVDTVVTGNIALANHPDFCDDGVGTVLSNNTFGTVGPCFVQP
ncbi:MAG TPA: hypothetical protein VF310_14010 [Vicinamibacteria bacterium]